MADAPKSGPRRIGARRPRRTIPDSILNDPEIARAASALPTNYAFEIHKTIWKIREADPPVKKVALQLPEGLLMFACAIGDILERFTGAQFVVLGDVTYGACCVDDLTAKQIGCDFLVHYGHSCLVPVQANLANPGSGAADAGDDKPLRTLYVFVEIGIDVTHLVACVAQNFGALETRGQPLTLMGTIQFAGALHEASGKLRALGFKDLLVPQAKPLSPGETLGCTSPRLLEEPTESGGGAAAPRQGRLVFVADGRFHLEAAMIHNPQLEHYRYDPYAKVMTRERYAVEAMKAARKAAVDQARCAKVWGVVLGTLGRQGNPAIVGHLRRRLRARGCKTVLVLLSEVFPAKLKLLGERAKVEAWVQVACPRLSIDWGAAFTNSHAPLLTPYEALVAIDDEKWREVYPMDYYASGSGPWTNQHHASRALDAQPKTLPA